MFCFRVWGIFVVVCLLGFRFLIFGLGFFLIFKVKLVFCFALFLSQPETTLSPLGTTLTTLSCPPKVNFLKQKHLILVTPDSLYNS